MSDTKTVKISGADYVVTVDSERRIIRNGSIVIRGDRIESVGPAAELADVQADEDIDGSGKLVTPGFIDTHEHLYGHVMRGMNSDVIDASYIQNACAVRDALTEEEEYLTTLASITEFLKYGTTCYVNPGDGQRLDAVMRAYEQTCCRVIVGRNETDRPNTIGVPISETAEAVRRLESTLDEYDGRYNGRVSAWVMLAYGTEMVSEELVIAAKKLADERGTGMTIHQSPRQGQVDQCLKEHGMRPLEYLDRIGVLGPNMLLGHAIRLDDNEVAIMARTDTKASMSPVTSMRLGFGTAGYGKLPEMLAAGATVGLGTDTTDFGIADMLKTAELASLLYKDAREDTSLISPEKALEMITIDGAKACGLDEQIGSLEAGKKADLVVFDTTRAEWQPLLNPVHALIYHADGRSVETVMVDGRTVVDDGRPTFVDEAALGAQLQADAEGLLERTGIVVTPRWPIIG